MHKLTGEECDDEKRKKGWLEQLARKDGLYKANLKGRKGKSEGPD